MVWTVQYLKINRFHGPTNREESWHRALWDLEAPELFGSVYAEEFVYGESGEDCGWELVLGVCMQDEGMQGYRVSCRMR